MVKNYCINRLNVSKDSLIVVMYNILMNLLQTIKYGEMNILHLKRKRRKKYNSCNNDSLGLRMVNWSKWVVLIYEILTSNKQSTRVVPKITDSKMKNTFKNNYL